MMSLPLLKHAEDANAIVEAAHHADRRDKPIRLRSLRKNVVDQPDTRSDRQSIEGALEQRVRARVGIASGRIVLSIGFGVGRVCKDGFEAARVGFAGILQKVGRHVRVKIERLVVWSEPSLIRIEPCLSSADVQHGIIHGHTEQRSGALGKATKIRAVVFDAALQFGARKEPCVTNGPIGHLATLTIRGKSTSQKAFAAAIILTLLAVGAMPAGAHDLAAWSDPARDQWYRSLKVPNSNTSCCDLRDGAEMNPDKVKQDSAGSWWVDLGAGFVPVPPDRVVRAPVSIDGLPYIFLMATPTADSPNGIRCLVPPVGTY